MGVAAWPNLCVNKGANWKAIVLDLNLALGDCLPWDGTEQDLLTLATINWECRVCLETHQHGLLYAIDVIDLDVSSVENIVL